MISGDIKTESRSRLLTALTCIGTLALGCDGAAPMPGDAAMPPPDAGIGGAVAVASRMSTGRAEIIDPFAP